MQNILKLICAVLMAIWFGLMPDALAQGSRESAKPLKLNKTMVSLDELGRQWRHCLKTMEAGQPGDAEEALRRLRRMMAEGGVERFDAAAQRLLFNVERLRKTGQFEAASDLLVVARSLAPGLPAIEFAQARLRRSESPFAVHTWGMEELRARVATVVEARARMDSVVSGLLWAAVLGALVIFIFGLCQLVRYGLHLLYDFAALIPAVSGVTSAFVTVSMLVATALVTGNAVPTIAGLFVLLSLYQARGERVMTVASGLFVAALILLGPWLNHARQTSFQETRWVEQVSINPTDRQSQAALSALLDEAKAPTARLILARSLKRAGFLEDAHGQLMRLDDRSNLSKEIRGQRENLLGNLAFIQGQAAQAEKHYLRALRLVGESPQVLFNLHRLEARRGDAIKAEEYARRASERAGTDVARWAESRTLGHNEYIVDGTPNLTAALAELVFRVPAQGSVLSIGDRLAELVLVLTAALLIVFLGALRSRLRLSFPCQKCMAASKQKPSQVDFADAFCSVCTDLFILGKPLDRRTRFAKEIAVRRVSQLKKWGGRGAAFCLPGVVQLLHGRVFHGWIFVMCALALVVAMLMPYGLARSALEWPMDDRSHQHLLWAGLASLSLLSGLQCIRWTRETRRVA
ncbi:MAG: tetratricopeptide repeat protein [Myxococcota bacterium]|nr:tetratricopeptide repeat protein [Myxococcota bacterium]